MASLQLGALVHLPDHMHGVLGCVVQAKETDGRIERTRHFGVHVSREANQVWRSLEGAAEAAQCRGARAQPVARIRSHDSLLSVS
jgi:hypothetical protein